MKKNLFQIILFCSLFFIINLLIGHFLEQPREQLIKEGKFTPYNMWKDFYSQAPHSLDLLFLGSSHCYRSFDPEIFDTSLGIRSFNMGTPSQCPVTSYFVLKEALKTQKPKMVVLEIFWKLFAKDDQFDNAHENYKYMRYPDVKNEFYQKGFNFQGKLLLFFPSYYYRLSLENAFRWVSGKDLIGADKEKYKGKGFVESSEIVSLDKLNKKNQFDGSKLNKDKMDPDQLLYVRKIVELCRSEGISVVFVTAPYPPITFAKFIKYNEIHDYVAQMAAGLNLPYIDSIADTPPDLFKNEDFSDEHHMNETGVKKFDDYVISRLRLIKTNGLY